MIVFHVADERRDGIGAFTTPACSISCGERRAIVAYLRRNVASDNRAREFRETVKVSKGSSIPRTVEEMNTGSIVAVLEDFPGFPMTRVAV